MKMKENNCMSCIIPHEDFTFFKWDLSDFSTIKYFFDQYFYYSHEKFLRMRSHLKILIRIAILILLRIETKIMRLNFSQVARGP